jgi:CO/xanthine dehydrogenase FAD-binding subunit
LTLQPDEQIIRIQTIDGEPLIMYLRPRTLDEACGALAASPMRILAGGTDVFPALGDQHQPEPILDISRLGDLEGITIGPDEVRIGARTTWTAVSRASLPPCFAALKQAAREVGSVQIQNTGTVAGNICNASPAADGVPPLLALDAEVELASLTGTRKLPLHDFILGNRRTARRPDEILTAITVPRTIDNGRSAFLKLGARRYLVISIAIVAAIVETDTTGHVAAARIAVGACSEVARRLPRLERVLEGAPARVGLGSIVEPSHLQDLAPIDDIRATAVYRREAVRSLVARALDTAVARVTA